MHRRQFLRKAAIPSVACLTASLSGCTKAKNTVLAGGTVDVEDTRGTYSESGVLILQAFVKNSSNEHMDRIVVAKASVEGADTQRIRKLAALGAGESQTFEFRFAFDRQLSESIIDYDIFLK